MKAAILCPGPSLRTTWPDAEVQHDIVIAVNRAATMGCDWLAAFDHETLRDFMAYASEGIVSLTSGCGSVVASGLRTVDATTLASDVPLTFTKAGALLLAAHLGATEVDVYGDDMTGRAYFDGTLGNSTAGGRWEREARDVGIVEALLASRGVMIRRIVSPVFASYATPEYAGELQGLSDSAEPFNLPAWVAHPSSMGSWVRNCGEKPRMIAAAREDHPGRAVVYLDADARVLRRPSLFARLDCDVAFHRLRREGDGIGELLSGTLYFAPTDAATRLIDAWIRETERTPEEWDQRCLSRALALTEGVRSTELPWTYCHVDGHNPKDDRKPVIFHRQASRTLKDVVNGTVSARA